MLDIDKITLGTLAIFGFCLGVLFPMLWDYFNLFTWFWAGVFILSTILLIIKIKRSYEH